MRVNRHRRDSARLLTGAGRETLRIGVPLRRRRPSRVRAARRATESAGGNAVCCRRRGSSLSAISARLRARRSRSARARVLGGVAVAWVEFECGVGQVGRVVPEALLGSAVGASPRYQGASPCTPVNRSTYCHASGKASPAPANAIEGASTSNATASSGTRSRWSMSASVPAAFPFSHHVAMASTWLRSSSLPCASAARAGRGGR